MNAQKIPYKTTATRFVRTIKDLANSEVGGTAKFMFAGLVLLLVAANGLNVLNSFVGRNFMTSIANRDRAEFIRQALFYIGVFAASTVVSVIIRFIEERLGLLWRGFLTRRSVRIYLANAAYYRLSVSGELANPDQRIAEDIRAFTANTLSFVLMALNSGFTILAFAGVLWTISPLLFVVAVLYAAFGSYMTIVLGRPLIGLNSDQLDKEASFRSGLIHVRENAESIVLSRQEERQSARLLDRLDDLIANFRRITAINRNVGFFTTGYNWMIQIIPALIIAPAFISGRVEFGVITQSAMAFSSLVAAFSLIVTQFQSLSTFAAVIARLSSMVDAIERSQATGSAAIEVVEVDGPLGYEDLTLLVSTSGKPLLRGLSLSIPFGTRTLVAGPNQTAGAALFRATAGLSAAGSGRVIRPRANDILFLPQRPFLPPSALRDFLVPSGRKGEVSDDRIFGLMRELNLERAVSDAGGLDSEQTWQTRLSLREQHLLVFLHTLLAAPRFVFIDHIDAELGSDQMRAILRMLSENSIAYVHNGEEDDAARNLYDAVLVCGEDGGWKWRANPA